VADQSKIEWTDATWNPTRGCKVVSPGCRNCYAMKVAARFAGPGLPYEGLAFMHEKAGGQWTGKGMFVDDHLLDPLRWKRPRRIFVNSMSDLFYEGFGVGQIADVFAVMYLAPHHTFQVLTKRSERMRMVLNAPGFYEQVLAAAERIMSFMPKQTHRHTRTGAAVADPTKHPAPWVHLGVSVESPDYLDRLTDLASTPAGLRFASFEPLLADLGNLREWLTGPNRLNWAIVGGESGSGARMFDTGWARSIVQQCAAAGVACFVKQLGSVPTMTLDEWRSGGGRQVSPENRDKAAEGHVAIWLESRKGGDMLEWPPDLRVREFPGARS
jgi:protein gp37